MKVPELENGEQPEQRRASDSRPLGLSGVWYVGVLESTRRVVLGTLDAARVGGFSFLFTVSSCLLRRTGCQGRTLSCHGAD